MTQPRPWGHIPRSCRRCGDVAPRVWLKGVGYVHYYCLTEAEKRDRANEQKQAKKGAASHG